MYSIIEYPIARKIIVAFVAIVIISWLLLVLIGPLFINSDSSQTVSETVEVLSTAELSVATSTEENMP